MATKGDKDQPGRWKGDEVEDRRGTEAEQAAARAEGNSPVRAEDEERRLSSPGTEEQPAEIRRTRRDGPSDDEEIEDVAEEHRARRDAGERPPRGKL
jgi:hypothetical protein